MPDISLDKAFVLANRRFGERSWIVSLLSESHGRMSGLYRNKQAPEPATIVSARWQARLAEQLGRFTLEEAKPVAVRYLDDRKRLSCLASLCGLLYDFLPENQPFPKLYKTVSDFVENLDSPDFLKAYVLLEKELLSEVGFGLDLSTCAGGGDPNDLAYVSPKTGRAVSREKGAPYHAKLLPLPRFMWQDVPADELAIRAGLKLTGYFLEQHMPHHRLPEARRFL